MTFLNKNSTIRKKKLLMRQRFPDKIRHIHSNCQTSTSHMNLFVKPISFLLAIFYSINLYSQDLHFTQNTFVLPYYNPAETGHFRGTIRLGGIYREQFSSFISKPYSSPLGYLDSPISYGFNQKQWIGGGMTFYSDQSGDLKLRNSAIHGSLSYHISFNNKFNSVISVGINYGNVRISTDSKNALFKDQYEENKPSKDLGLIDNFNTSYKDIGLGIKYRKKHDLFSEWVFGLSILHLNSPKIRFQNGTRENKISARTNIYVSNGWELNNQNSIIPAIFFSKFRNTNNTSIQCSWKHQFKSNGKSKKLDHDKLSLQFGIGYRIQDAIQFLASSQYDNWNIGLSYDLTISSASNYNNYYGAYELCFSRVLHFPKKPKINSVFYCPRF